jgi:hypothetical protein
MSGGRSPEVTFTTGAQLAALTNGQARERGDPVSTQRVRTSGAAPDADGASTLARFGWRSSYFSQPVEAYEQDV